MNGTTNSRMIQPAFAHPLRSSRRKMSVNSAMKSQIAMIHRKNTNMVHNTLPNDQSVASIHFLLAAPLQPSPVGGGGSFGAARRSAARSDVLPGLRWIPAQAIGRPLPLQ